MEVSPRHPERIAAARMAIINHDRMKAELLHFYCTTHWGFEVVALEFTGTEGIAAVARTKPDFVLVSLMMMDVQAPELIRRITEVSSASKVIGQAGDCRDYPLHLLAGATYHGLVHGTEESLEALGWTIERVRQGLRSVSPRIAHGQAALRSSPDAFPKLLSKREQEVMVCVAHAMTDEEIGASFQVSASTALSHRKKIMHKLGIHSTPKLMRYCAEKGFNSAPPLASPRIP
jgi:DNA-binding NarL/FixJ family response regulator